MPDLGKKAPAFTLLDQDGDKIKLSDFKGCTAQACGFRDQYADLTAAGTVVLGLSPDAPAKLARWGEKKMYDRTLEGDIRSHFVIDADGKLVDQHLKISPQDSVDRAVSFLQDRV